MSTLIQPETWTDFSHLRWTKREKVHSRMGKVKFEEFLAQHNFPYSKILKKFQNPEEISFENLPDYFVLKPSQLWSARGVMLLNKIGKDCYKDDMSGLTLSSSAIVEKLKELRGKVNTENLPVLIEERAIDENEKNIIPLDYKLFTFNGNVKFILQVDRNHKKPKIAFFDGDFFPITDGRVVLPEGKEDILGQPKRPACYSELIELASALSVKLKSPFISIDCYATKNGPLFGELTHTPGGPWFGIMYLFSEEFDKELGAAWRKAAQQLNVEIPKVESEYDIFLKGRLVRKIRRGNS